MSCFYIGFIAAEKPQDNEEIFSDSPFNEILRTHFGIKFNRCPLHILNIFLSKMANIAHKLF